MNLANAVEGGRELSQTILYVGGVHKTVTEAMLRELFSSLGAQIQSIKLLYDKNKPGFHYSFIEYADHASAENALRTFNGTILADYPLTISWAFQTQQTKAGESYNLFIGDLSPELNDDALNHAFSQFPSKIQANVMWDMKSGRSRGYGFVSFKDVADAEKALQTMNGEVLAGRAIRLNWAARKQNPNGQNGAPGLNIKGHHNNGSNLLQNGPLGQPGMPPLNGGNLLAANGGAPQLNGQPGQPGAPGSVNGGKQQQLPPQSYEIILRQAPNWQTTVYLGNLAHFTTQNDLIPLLQNFGYIVDFKFHPEKGCAFVGYDSHERAALAIFQLSGFTINGRPLKCGWGKQQNGGPGPMNYMYRR
ncbi:unnamed protein product [Ambrosiozyma monospora]|uniref:Unnamed protein product n=1 Tax=Ambrosiozyma monospora TaxID=43982 RepID=A0ACB5TKD5_AMBMO|nr:unnamed protein product [Ambrosiozyma monospora]